MISIVKRRFTTVLLCAVLVTCMLASAASAEPKKKSYKPLSQYEERKLEGWTVYVEKSLLENHPKLAAEALRVAENQLFNITRVVPEQAVKKLRQVPVWMQYECKDMKCAAYHPSKRWLTEHGYNPKKAKCVDIGNARNFVRWTKDQWWMVLHEMAHAYHDRFLGFGNADIKAGYERVKKAGLYKEVRQWRGGQQRHYALENHKEYFAEMTEAYFGVNDFYPFVRAEMKECDPKTLKLIEELWGRK